MKTLRQAILATVTLVIATSTGAMAQNTFSVTGTVIPADLLQLNYGRLPSGISGLDLNICNSTTARQSVVSSEIYQALTQADQTLQPIGRRIMLSAILKNQNRSLGSLASMALNSTVGILSVLAATRNNIPGGLLAGVALGTMSAQQIFANLRPVLTSDQLDKFDSQVLESALVLDGGSCAERTVFTVSAAAKGAAKGLSFHVR